MAAFGVPFENTMLFFHAPIILVVGCRILEIPVLCAYDVIKGIPAGRPFGFAVFSSGSEGFSKTCCDQQTQRNRNINLD